MAAPITRTDAIDALQGLQVAGRLSRKRWAIFEKTLSPDEAADRLARGDSVIYHRDNGGGVLGSLSDLQAMDALEGKGRHGGVDPATAQMVRTLARGVREGDGMKAVRGAYEAWQRLAAGTPIAVRMGDREAEVRGVSDLGPLYHEAMSEAGLAEQVPTGKIRLRSVGENAAERISAIDRLAFAHPWATNDFRNALQRPEYAATVAMSGSQALGAIIVNHGRIEEDAACIDSLAVIPQAQGHRVGERLLLNALQKARRDGYAHAYLEVDVTNDAAQHLYRKMGFETVERLPDYYPEDGHDGWLMELKDLQSRPVGAHLAELRSAM